MGPIGRNNQQHAPTVATTPSHHTPSKNPSTPTPTLTIPASYRPSGAENGASSPPPPGGPGAGRRAGPRPPECRLPIARSERASYEQGIIEPAARSAP